MDLELTGKTAIVTGGSKGIGKAIARELVREGVAVVIASRTAEALDLTRRELADETGGLVFALPVDTRSDESVRQLVSQARELLGGRIDILVNSAARASGGETPPKLAGITADLLWEDVDTKVMGYLRCAREVAPIMIDQGWGRIINLSGLGARQATSTITSIRNAGVVALTKNLADELGPKGINVTAVHPGLTRTERTPGMIARTAESSGLSLSEAERQLASSNSTRRIVDAQEIAYVVAFLASPKSISINGDVIATGGGAGTTIHY